VGAAADEAGALVVAEGDGDPLQAVMTIESTSIIDTKMNQNFAIIKPPFPYIICFLYLFFIFKNFTNSNLDNFLSLPN
jgi:hypothetical protein